MDKWLFWGLVEGSTILFAITVYFSWCSWKLYKRSNTPEESPEENAYTKPNVDIDPLQTENRVVNSDSFIQYIDQHITVALDKLEALRQDPEKQSPARNKYKLWGTLLKAQRAMFLHDKQLEPLPILQRFLSTVLDAVTKESKNGERIDSIKLALSDVAEEVRTLSQEVASNITSLEQQKTIQEEIRSSLSRKNQVLASIDIKENELKELNLFLKESRQTISKLKASLAKGKNSDLVKFSEEFDFQYHAPEKSTDYADYQSLKQLTSLSRRQQIVIDQLKISLRSSKKRNHAKEDQESQAVALQRLMRLSDESNSLIQQLENEVKSENLTIEGMKNKLSQKEEKIKELETKIKESDSSFSDSLKTHTLQKTQTLNTYKSNISNSSHLNLSEDFLKQQTSEVEQLERLLSESETCVTLLGNELSSAEEENINLLKQVEAISGQVSSLGNNQDSSDKLEKINNDISQLQKTISKLNISLLNSPTPNNFDTIKARFDTKKMELDRLEFAHADLEKKYLKALQNKEASN